MTFLYRFTFSKRKKNFLYWDKVGSSDNFKGIAVNVGRGISTKHMLPSDKKPKQLLFFAKEVISK